MPENPARRLLITGSAGLVGSDASHYFASAGWEVHGVDNFARQSYLGPGADTRPACDSLIAESARYHHYEIDIRDARRIADLFKTTPFDAVLHCAGQPSHEFSAMHPLLDFEVNATGTLNVLEAIRQHCPEAPVVVLSTNKVYGDRVNHLPLVETDTRFDFAGDGYRDGIDETFGIDQTLHSPFGVAKVAADLMAQEYGQYYGLLVGVFRCGCITGRRHTATQAQGFLGFLCTVARRGDRYRIIGYRGKQVRDQLHSSDLVAAIEAFLLQPRRMEVYNLGGGRENSISVLEAIAACESTLGRTMTCVYEEEPRRGDHICWITNTSKFRSHYPSWAPTFSLPRIIEEMTLLSASSSQPSQDAANSERDHRH